MSTTHERPGVYSSYDVSSIVSGGRANKVIGVAARAVRGTALKEETLTGYASGVSIFGEDAAGSPGMSTLLRLVFANGGGTVKAVAVGGSGTAADYAAAFAVLAQDKSVQILLCDSADVTVQQKLRDSAAAASETRKTYYSVKNKDFMERGGQCRRVVYTPGQSTYAAMRYTGAYQIERSQEEEIRVELCLPQVFAAFPGDRVRLELNRSGICGSFQVAEAENSLSDAGETLRLTLKEEM